MRIAIAGGKGGTGKTTFATNLAVALAAEGHTAAYLDCDVEEPNGHIFLRPEIRRRREVGIPVPEVDLSLCTFCGACEDVCRFSAIITIGQKVLTFPKLCHGCGGCRYVCREQAIREVMRPIGIVEEGSAGEVAFVHGRLNIGEPMSPPLIRAVLESAPVGHSIIVDAPPGTTCPSIAAIKGSDVVLLVTEPTPFGTSDLELAVEMVHVLGLPLAVAVNRADIGDRQVFDLCRKREIPIVFTLDDDRRIAESYSRGELALHAIPELTERFQELGRRLGELASGPRRFVAPVAADHGGSLATPPVRPSSRLSLAPLRPARELVVLSGKGGTGKTSMVASFFALAGHAVAVDCDADAPDLHLVIEPQIRARWPFSSGQTARIDPMACILCGLCFDTCRFDAIRPAYDRAGYPVLAVDPVSCEGCGVCVNSCPEHAVTLVPSSGSEWFLSSTRHGPAVHARLGIAQGNSGKLVSLVRQEARAVATNDRLEWILVDGSPGIGCPVIASITGADMVLLVSEPTLSAMHDLERVAELCRQLQVPAALCINKADLNAELADELEQRAERLGLPVFGRIRYDQAVTRAQLRHRSVVEDEDSPAAQDVRDLWVRVREAMECIRQPESQSSISLLPAVERIPPLTQER